MPSRVVGSPVERPKSIDRSGLFRIAANGIDGQGFDDFFKIMTQLKSSIRIDLSHHMVRFCDVSRRM